MVRHAAARKKFNVAGLHFFRSFVFSYKSIENDFSVSVMRVNYSSQSHNFFPVRELPLYSACERAYNVMKVHKSVGTQVVNEDAL